MAFFKFRTGADVSPRAPAQPPSIEAIRQRAKYRLAGATVLVLAGVLGLPLLFDKQPRPIAVDTPISIPVKNKLPPLVMPAAAPKVVAADKPASTATAQPAELPAVVSPPVPADKKFEEIVSQAPVDKGLAATKSVSKESAQPAKAAAVTPVSKPLASSAATASPTGPKPALSAAAESNASRAQALLDGKGSPSSRTAVTKPLPAEAAPAKPVAAAEGRFIVQVGAFADNARAHEVRLKLEHAGLKTYAQALETKDGKRIRVRVGPFATKADADKVAEKIKKLNLPAALLTL